MTAIESLLTVLADKREQLAATEKLVAEAEKTIREEVPAYANRDTLRAEVKRIETEIRQITLQAWVTTGSPPHPGVKVRKMLRYRYLNEEIVQWIIEQVAEHPELLLLLTVDKQALETGIKNGTIQCPYVYPQYDPQPTISTNLKKILAGDETYDE